jgi:hypothetical protein
VIGDFANSFVLPNDSEGAACQHKLDDVKQLGLLIDVLLKMCDEESAKEVRTS